MNDTFKKLSNELFTDKKLNEIVDSIFELNGCFEDEEGYTYNEAFNKEYSDISYLVTFLAGVVRGKFKIKPLSDTKEFGCEELIDGLQMYCSEKVEVNIETIENILLKSCNIRLNLQISLDSYFEGSKDEDFKTIEELLSGQNEETEEENEDKKLKNIDEYESSVILATEQILGMYTSLFESGYELVRPVGLLIPTGMVTIKNDELIIKQDSQLSAMYSVLTSGSNYNFDNTDTMFSTEAVSRGVTYFTCLLLSFMYGRRLYKNGKFNRYYIKTSDGHSRCTWKDYKSYLEKILASLIEDIVISAGSDSVLPRISEALTNCIIVTEFNPRIALKLRYANLQGHTSEYFTGKIHQGLFQKRGTIEYLNENKGITDLTIVFDIKKYSGFPIFAFQALEVLKERGELPSWNKVLLGRGTDDKIYSHNFADDHFTTNIVAGSGSGKGVTTLNIVASALGSNIPIFYNDCKPDMSETIHDLARGIKSYSFDAKVPKWGSEYDGDGWKRTIPPELLEVTSGYLDYGSLMYMKSMQVMLMIARLRQKGMISKYNLDKEMLGGDRCLFVLDEFLAVNNFLEKFVITLENACKLIDSKDKKDSVIYQYYNKIRTWLMKVSAELSNYYQADGRFSDTNLIILFQEVNGENVESFKKTNIFTIALKNQNGMCKLLGRGVSTGYVGTLGIKGSPEFSLIEQQRYFGYTSERQCKEVSNIKVFKPYLILNTVDESHPCMTGIRKIEGIEDIIGEQGNARPEIAIEGYVKAMLPNVDIASKINQSYNIAQYVLNMIGYDGTVEDYLYDFSMESYRSIDNMIDNIGKEDLSNVELEDDEYTENSEEDNYQDIDYTEADSDNIEFSDSAEEYDSYDDEGNLQEGKHSSQQFKEPKYSPHEHSSNNPEIDSLQRRIEELEQLLEGKEGYKRAYGDNIEEDPDNKGFTVPFKRNILGEDKEIRQFIGEMNLGSNFRVSANLEDTAKNFNNISKVLYQNILNMFGGADRIFEFVVMTNSIIINNIVFSPKLREDFIDSMPIDVKSQLKEGRYAWLFNYAYLKQFKNLSTLYIDDMQFAYNKVRIDMGYNSNFNPMQIVKSVPSISYLTIGSFVYDKSEINEDEAYINSESQFKTEHRSTQIADRLDDLGVHATKASWNKVGDIYKSKRTRGVMKGLGVASMVGVATVATGGTLLYKLSRGLFNVGNSFIKSIKNN